MGPEIIQRNTYLLSVFCNKVAKQQICVIFLKVVLAGKMPNLESEEHGQKCNLCKNKSICYKLLIDGSIYVIGKHFRNK
jgi:hypothetical protein